MNMEHLKRKLMASMAALPLLMSCKTASSDVAPRLSEAQKKLQGIGLTLVVDAVPGAEMLGTEFFADGYKYPFYAKSRMVKTNRSIMSFPGRIVPIEVRVVWRKKDESFFSEGRIRYGGEIQGDYTIPVASRIPEAVIQDIRAKGGGLRLKFRLKPDGVLFGWDIERSVPVPGVTAYRATVIEMPGGDFLDTKY
jgi:hypothetical protein